MSYFPLTLLVFFLFTYSIVVITGYAIAYYIHIYIYMSAVFSPYETLQFSTCISYTIFLRKFSIALKTWWELIYCLAHIHSLTHSLIIHYITRVFNRLFVHSFIVHSFIVHSFIIHSPTTEYLWFCHYLFFQIFPKKIKENNIERI